MKLKKILWYLVAPLVFLLAVMPRVLSLSSPAKFRDDSRDVFDMLWEIFDAIWAWLSGPPLWATTAALVLVTFAYIIWIFGDDRLIRFSRIVFSKAARLAEFSKLADDKALVTYKKAIAAKVVLENENFDHIPQLPPPANIDLSQAVGATEVIWDQIQDHENRIQSRISNICACMGPVHIGSFGANLTARIREAGLSAYKDRDNWENFENNGLFLDDRHRNRFHRLRCETDAINKASDELLAHLRDIDMKCLRAVDEDIRSQILLELDEKAAR